MAPTASEPLGNLLRLTPLHHSDLPVHPTLPDQPDQPTSRPQLLPFLLNLLAQGSSFLSPTTFPSTFTKHSTKSDSSTANVPVEVHKRDVAVSQLQSIEWDSDKLPVKRRKPSRDSLSTEHWFTRHSRHPNVPSPSAEKIGGASFSEFVFGLRDSHSKHEQDFTPTLYDARHILDWNEEINTLEAQGKLSQGDQGQSYSNATMSVYEMCHAIPAPLQPRCFPVLVVTASTSPISFIAVTVPLDLGKETGFYSAAKNLKDGADAQQKKQTVTGAYVAVETVYIDKKRDGEEGEEIIDWTMATASDTRGNLPMWAQKMGLPGAVVKDVGYFLKWIRKVPRQEISGA